MDLSFTPEELKFRDEVRAFLKAKLPKDIAEKIVASEFGRIINASLAHNKP